MQKLAIYFSAALAISLALTPICRAVAKRLGFVAVALTVLTLGVSIGPDPRLWQLMACGALIASFGLVDDVLSLKTSTKLIVQITVASILLFFGYRLEWTSS